MTLLLFALCQCDRLDEVSRLRQELSDASYGNLWDRREAARDLGRIGTRPAIAVLFQFSGSKSDPATREAIVMALGRLASPEIRRYAVDCLPCLKDPQSRVDLLRALREMNWDPARDGVHRAMKDPVADVRVEAARTLGALRDPRCAEAAADPSPEVAEEGYLAAAALKVPVAGGERHLSCGPPRVRAAALRWKAAVEPQGFDVAPFLKGAPEVRMAAADVAGSVEPLVKLLNDPDWRVRAAAIAALERLWTPEAVGALVDRLADEDGRLVMDIVMALRRMTDRDIGTDPQDWKIWWNAHGKAFKMPPPPSEGGCRLNRPSTRAKSSFFGLPILSKRVTFVLDVSGSMKNEDEVAAGRRKIDVALEELARAVGGLPDDARFNVVLLSTEATRRKMRSLAPRLVPASASHRAKAVDAVARAWGVLEGEKRGRGDIFDAIVEAAADPETDTVILLSDGKPTDGTFLERELFLAALARHHRDRRVAVHAVLTGSRGVDAEMMRGISRVTGGVFVERTGEGEGKGSEVVK